MQTSLEKNGITKRQESIVRNDYTKSDEYSANHKDALSDGDAKGKGSGHGGHSHVSPGNNFITDPSLVGGKYDIDGYEGNGGRNFLFNINTYNSSYEYSENLISTEANQADGQIVI